MSGEEISVQVRIEALETAGIPRYAARAVVTCRGAGTFISTWESVGFVDPGVKAVQHALTKLSKVLEEK